jgi:hypothetical protein
MWMAVYYKAVWAFGEKSYSAGELIAQGVRKKATKTIAGRVGEFE